jgi:hypothetical protein
VWVKVEEEVGPRPAQRRGAERRRPAGRRGRPGRWCRRPDRVLRTRVRRTGRRTRGGGATGSRRRCPRGAGSFRRGRSGAGSCRRGASDSPWRSRVGTSCPGRSPTRASPRPVAGEPD